MDHHDTMLYIFKAPDGKHFRIASRHHEGKFLRILPDGTIDANGTIDSPYGEFEMSCPRAFHLQLTNCYTGFHLASTNDGKPLCGVKITSEKLNSCLFKFIMPPSAGIPNSPLYYLCDLTLLLAAGSLHAASSMTASMTMPNVKITGPEVQLDEHGRIVGVKHGSMEVLSSGSLSVSASSSVGMDYATRLQQYKGTGTVCGCQGFLPNAVVSKDPVGGPAAGVSSNNVGISGVSTPSVWPPCPSDWQPKGFAYQQGAPPVRIIQMVYRCFREHSL